MEGYLEDGKLTLGVSRMYSFKTNSEAPFELFEGWLLGDPVGLTPASRTSDKASHKRPRRSQSTNSGKQKKRRQ
jgi:hypothetical protein